MSLSRLTDPEAGFEPPTWPADTGQGRLVRGTPLQRRPPPAPDPAPGAAAMQEQAPRPPAPPPADPAAAAIAGLERARAHADALLAAAREETEALHAATRAEGYVAGHAEGVAAGRAGGYAAGRSQADAEAAALLAEARAEREAAAVTALAARQEALAAAADDVLRLALAVARQILHQELTLRPEAAVAMVTAAIASAQGDPAPRVRLHPDTLALVEQEGARGAVLQSDPGLAPGDFVLQSSVGQIDGRIEQQLAEVATALTETPDDG